MTKYLARYALSLIILIGQKYPSSDKLMPRRFHEFYNNPTSVYVMIREKKWKDIVTEVLNLEFNSMRYY